jgi:hypothetical protein
MYSMLRFVFIEQYGVKIKKIVESMMGARLVQPLARGRESDRFERIELRRIPIISRKLS